MRITGLIVENFRAIDRIELTELKDMIVIAGPNGCGKSCILDAIRLFKSAYGGYQPNEWHQWLNEFQIRPRDMSQMTSLLRNRTMPSTIEAKITLADEERKYIEHNANQMLMELAWNTVVPNPQSWSRSANSLATELRAYAPRVDEMVQNLYPKIVEQLNHREILGKI